MADNHEYTTESYVHGKGLVKYTYDADDKLLEASYEDADKHIHTEKYFDDGIDRYMTSETITSPKETLTLEYDKDGRITSHLAEHENGSSEYYEYSYDENGDKSTDTYSIKPAPTTPSASATGTNSQSTKNTITLPNGQQIITESIVEETPEGTEKIGKQITETNADGTPRKVTIEKTDYKSTTEYNENGFSVRTQEYPKTDTKIVERFNANGDLITKTTTTDNGSVKTIEVEYADRTKTTTKIYQDGSRTITSSHIDDKGNEVVDNKIVNSKIEYDSSDDQEYRGTDVRFYDGDGTVTNNIKTYPNSVAGGEQANREQEITRENILKLSKDLSNLAGPLNSIKQLKNNWTTDGGTASTEKMNQSCTAMSESINSMKAASDVVGNIKLRLEPEEITGGACAHQ